MNMFRDLLMAGLIILGVSVAGGDPTSWTWPQIGGPYLQQSINFLADYRPYSYMLCFALALALFMTRLKY